MKLSEALKEHDFVYIGSASGYVFTGHSKDAFVELPKIDKKYLDRLKQLVDKHKRILKSCKNDAEKKRYERRIHINEKKIATFKPFLDREVIEVYPHNNLQPFGTAIIVNGYERGFWMYEEYVNSTRKTSAKNKTVKGN